LRIPAEFGNIQTAARLFLFRQGSIMADQTSAASDGEANLAGKQPSWAATEVGNASSAQSTRPIDLDLPRLVADHADELYRYAFRLTGSVADAEDLTQQTFLTAHEKLSQLRDAAGVRGWLFTVLRHACLRSQKTHRRLPLAGGSFNIETVPDEVVDSVVVDQELLQAAINELPEVYKLVVLAFYFEDLSYREIAERLDLPVGTVMSRLSRGKNLLRSRLLEAECAPAGGAEAASASRATTFPQAYGGA
jgi:RNA polymerase sigma-70 factor (ECF subfamily)